MRYADEVPGTKIGFAYENSGDFEALGAGPPPGRHAMPPKSRSS